MSNTVLWTVYTVETHPLNGFGIVTTVWDNQQGPLAHTRKVVAHLVDVSLKEAERQAAEMQARYDRLRNVMLATW